jgi:hypothetical protein
MFPLPAGIHDITVLILGGHDDEVAGANGPATVCGDLHSKGVSHWQGIITLMEAL